MRGKEDSLTDSISRYLVQEEGDKVGELRMAAMKDNVAARWEAKADKEYGVVLE